MVKNLRQATKETSKAVVPNGPWQQLTPTEQQQRNFVKAIFRYCIDNGGQQASLRRSTQQALKILPFLVELSPEWQGATEKTFHRKASPQHKAFFRTLDKYGKTAPAQELLDAESKAWQLQKGT